MFEGARIELELDGDTYVVPFDTDFADLTPDEARLAAQLPTRTRGGVNDPVALTVAFLFVKAQRHVDGLDHSRYVEFLEALRPLFDGDESIVALVDDLPAVTANG